MQRIHFPFQVVFAGGFFLVFRGRTRSFLCKKTK